MITKISIFILKGYRFLRILYLLSVLFVNVIDKIVEAIMIKTIHRLTDSQKYVMKQILILIGLGLVKQYS